jgi:hypothetical protein
MVFTKFGRIVTWLIFVLGSFQFILGFIIAFGTESMEDNRFFAQRYFNEANSGDAIEKGQVYIFIAIALEIATEISRNIHKNRADSDA